jgi:hypothetical protein
MPGDRVRLLRIGLRPDGMPALGERYTDTFAVTKVEDDGKSFQIPVYESWSKYPNHAAPMSSIDILKQPSGAKGPSLLCAWRPIVDRGAHERRLPSDHTRCQLADYSSAPGRRHRLL